MLLYYQESNLRDKIDATLPWVKNYDRVVADAFEVPTNTLSQNLQASAAKFPNRTCLQFMHSSYSYRQVNEHSSRLAGVLQTLGYQKQDVIAILMPNSYSLVLSYFAILKMGGVVVFLNPAHTHDEIVFQLSDSGAKGVLVFKDLLDRNTLPDRNELPNLKYRIAVEEEPELWDLNGLNWLHQYIPAKLERQIEDKLGQIGSWWRKPKQFVWEEQQEVLDLTSLLKNQLNNAFLPVAVSLKDLAVIQYTGGTTGVIKGAMLTHENLCFNVNQVRSWFYFLKDGEENFLATIPFYHVFGLTVNLNLAIRMSATITIMPRFSVGNVLQMINQFQPTIFAAVPAVFTALLDSPGIEKINWDCFTNYFSGSASLAQDLKDRWLEMTGVDIVEGYGTTEASPVISISPLFGTRKEGSVGLPLPLTEVKIVDLNDDEKQLGFGEVGELWVRGPQVMKGYWSRADETKIALPKSNWLRTGDVAQMDSDGYLFLVDRLKDMVTTAGHNVFTREIDDLMQKHPDVQEAVAVGVDDLLKGQLIKLFVVPKVGAGLTEEEVVAFCKQSLAAYKIPKSVEFIDRLPRAESGEVLKKDLRARGLHVNNGEKKSQI